MTSFTMLKGKDVVKSNSDLNDEKECYYIEQENKTRRFELNLQEDKLRRIHYENFKKMHYYGLNFFQYCQKTRKL